MLSLRLSSKEEPEGGRLCCLLMADSLKAKIEPLLVAREWSALWARGSLEKGDLFGEGGLSFGAGRGIGGSLSAMLTHWH